MSLKNFPTCPIYGQSLVSTHLSQRCLSGMAAKEAAVEGLTLLWIALVVGVVASNHTHGAGMVRNFGETPRMHLPLKVYRCGTIGKDMVTNFVNQNYPGEDTSTGDCSFRLVLTSPQICQLRVDIVDTELMDPTRGECLSQSFIVEGAIWSTGLPPICGVNPDQHFYLHLEPWSGNTSVVDFKVVTVIRGSPYKFGIWITQIDCAGTNILKAPKGCTQYFLTDQGTIKSFNYDGFRYLNGQNYKICIKASSGVCGIRFESSPGDFSVKKSTAGTLDQLTRSGVGTTTCSGSYLMIPEGSSSLSRPSEVRTSRLLFNRMSTTKKKGSNKKTTQVSVSANRKTSSPASQKRRLRVVQTHDRFCGSHLAPVGGESVNRPIYARVRSGIFSLQFRTSPLQATRVKGDNFNLTLGFKISYSQLKLCDTETVDLVVSPTLADLVHSMSQKISTTLDAPFGSRPTELADDDKIWDYLQSDEYSDDDIIGAYGYDDDDEYMDVYDM